MSTENLVSEESARASLDVFQEYYDIDINDIEVKDGPEAVRTLLNGLVRAIQRGNVAVEMDGDTGELIVRQAMFKSPNGPKELVYRDRIVAAKVAMDSAGNKDEMRKLAFMSTLADTEAGQLLKLRGADVTTMNRISVFFSMV